MPAEEILLGARVSGDWTRALNAFARENSVQQQHKQGHGAENEKGRNEDVKVVLMLDGPYGGPSIDCADYENVLFVAGGSGVTFTLALLDDVVGRIVRSRSKSIYGKEKTKRIEFAWCVRSFGNSQSTVRIPSLLY